MDDYKDSIAACCKQLRLSVNLVENAMIQTGESHQEYLIGHFTRVQTDVVTDHDVDHQK